MSLKEKLKKGLMKTSAIIFRNKGSKILYYHDVFKTNNFKALDAEVYMGTEYDAFKKHIDAIKEEGFEIVKDISQPNGQVAIMFDDGFRGIWECRQYFYDENIYPTIFLPVEYIGKTGLGMLSLEEILELQKNGFKFECHGWSHRPLTDVNKDHLKKELVESRSFLSNLLGKEVTEICMPLGYFNDELIKEIKQAGYNKIYSCIPGNYNEAPFGLIGRNLCQNVSPSELRLILKGGNEILKKRYQKLHHKSN